MTTDAAGTEPYRTILRPVETELEIKRSRFLCFLSPTSTEEQARASIAEARKLHPKARHHCSAMVIGARGDLQRTNDDGEPSGTAGAPMLEALLGAELSDVVAVVVRYFGGTLLGAGGLTRAYRASVAESIEAAHIVVREQRLQVAVAADYASAALIEAESHRRGWVVRDSEYGAGVTLQLALPPGDLEQLSHRIAELSAGRALIEPGEIGYVTV